MFRYLDCSIKGVKVPVLILHALDDGVVPYELGHKVRFGVFLPLKLNYQFRSAAYSPFLIVVLMTVHVCVITEHVADIDMISHI